MNFVFFPLTDMTLWVKFLLENGADANIKDFDDKTPLDYAQGNGNLMNYTAFIGFGYSFLFFFRPFRSCKPSDQSSTFNDSTTVNIIQEKTRGFSVVGKFVFF